MLKTSLRTFGALSLHLSALWACSTEETDSKRPAPAACVVGTSGCEDTTSEDRESAGALAVEKRECTKCHDGPKGKMAGNATNLSTENGVELYAPNLTKDYDTGIGSWTDDQVAIAIRTGLDKDGIDLCPQMKHFADMEDEEAYAIIKYLRSLPSVANEVPRSVCPPLKVKEQQ